MYQLKRFLHVLQQSAIVTIISLAFTEVSFRIYNQVNPSFIFYEKSYGRFRGKPLSDHYGFPLNSYGYKDTEFVPEKEKNTYRIIGLGDSFAFGIVPYPDNYYTLVEQRLQQQGQNTEVYNFGIPNLNPKDYLSVLANEGLSYDGDMVVVSFFMGNDFLNSQDKNLSQPLYTYSYVLSFFKFLWDVQKNYEGEWELPENIVYDDDMVVFSDENYLGMEIRRSKIFFKNNPDFPATFDYALGFIQQIKEISDQHNMELLVAIVPDEVQVNTQLQEQVIQAMNVPAENLDFSLPNRLLAESFSELNINYIDLLQPFQEASKTTRLYRPNDSHWNIAGNHLAAEKISEAILQQLSESVPNQQP